MLSLEINYNIENITPIKWNLTLNMKNIEGTQIIDLHESGCSLRTCPGKN